MTYKVDMVTGPAVMKHAPAALCHAIAQLSDSWDEFTVKHTDVDGNPWMITAYGDFIVQLHSASKERRGKDNFGMTLHLAYDNRVELLRALAVYIERFSCIAHVLSIAEPLLQRGAEASGVVSTGLGEFAYVMHGDEMLHIDCKTPAEVPLFSLSIRYNVLDI